MVDCDGRRAPDRRAIEPWRMAREKYKVLSDFVELPSVHLGHDESLLRCRIARSPIARRVGRPAGPRSRKPPERPSVSVRIG
ncbi:protein of unknown function [Burkholderia multivorans]